MNSSSCLHLPKAGIMGTQLLYPASKFDFGRVDVLQRTVYAGHVRVHLLPQHLGGISKTIRSSNSSLALQQVSGQPGLQVSWI